MPIRNPVLPGFNADPSIVRVGEDYWIATSTFEWFPGVSLYRSTDLASWTHVANALDRPSQLDLRGVGDSCGVWAPSLSYRESDRLWCLAYTVVSNLSSSFFDLANYLVTADDPAGSWSEPVFLNARGFDPSLFHDDDGNCWLVGLAWEFRDHFPHPGPIVLQEFDFTRRRLVGEASEIYRGDTAFGCLEGPVIYKRNGWYYLVTAEGGTGYGHAVLVARGRSVTGPYEPSPSNPLLTSRAEPRPTAPDPDRDFLKPRFYNRAAALQKAGHGSLVETPTGETFLAHLCARPLGEPPRCILGRETALQKIVWTDDWPELSAGGKLPQLVVDGPDAAGDVTEPGRDDFTAGGLSPRYHALHGPITPDWGSLARPPGRLSIRGRNSLYDRRETSLIARRVQHFRFRAQTAVHFEPKNPRHMAGLIAMNGTGTWFFLRLYGCEAPGAAEIGIMVSDLGEKSEIDAATERFAIELLTGGVTLRMDVRDAELQFSWSVGNAAVRPIGPVLDASKLSDEYVNNGPGAFSGTFVGLCAWDLDQRDRWASFDYFDYLPGEFVHT